MEMVLFTPIEFHEPGYLLWLGRANQAETKRKARFLFRTAAAFAHNAAGQRLSRLDINRIVQRYKSLHGSIAANAFDGSGLPTRRVEGRHGRIRNRPPPKGVQTAAIAVLAFAGRPSAFAIEGGLPQAVGLRRIDTR